MSTPPLHDRMISEGCYLIGRRESTSRLQCNTYLRCFGTGTDEPAYWCVDPGPHGTYDEVRSHLVAGAGDLGALRLVSLSQETPDAAGNLLELTQENHSLTVLVSEHAWQLIWLSGASPKRLHFVEQSRDHLVKLRGGYCIQVVPIPFCPTRGATAYYDPESRILFSGDLLSGFRPAGKDSLFATQQDWPGIAQFHQTYMPSRHAVRHALEQIRQLDPPVEIIAPHHGNILRGDWMHRIIERLTALQVGTDLWTSESEQSTALDQELEESAFPDTAGPGAERFPLGQPTSLDELAAPSGGAAPVLRPAQATGSGSTMKRFLVQELIMLLAAMGLLLGLAYLRVWQFPAIVDSLGRAVGLELPQSLRPHAGQE